MTDEPIHFCPGCGATQKLFARYPWYLCVACLATAEDGEGRRLRFFNTGFSGGLGWSYADEPEMRDDHAVTVVCLIRARPVMITEARFGGVVAQPLTGAPTNVSSGSMVTDLTRGGLKAARERLKPVPKR
jgi:hypothetical protein